MTREARAVHCQSCGGPIDPGARACRHCGSSAATRRCASCLDLNLAGDRNCRRCGRRLPVQDEQRRQDRLECPGCGSAMSPRRSGEISFDECDRCGGLWLGPQTVEGLTTQAESRAHLRPFDAVRTGASSGPAAAEAPGHGAPTAYRRCPVCHKHMNRSNIAAGAGVVVDLCRDHGTHFDNGELTRLCEFIEAGGLDKARRREAESLKEEIRDRKRQAAAAIDSTWQAEMELASGAPGAFDLLGWLVGQFLRRS